MIRLHLVYCDVGRIGAWVNNVPGATIEARSYEDRDCTVRFDCLDWVSVVDVRRMWYDLRDSVGYVSSAQCHIEAPNYRRRTINRYLLETLAARARRRRRGDAESSEPCHAYHEHK